MKYKLLTNYEKHSPEVAGEFDKLADAIRAGDTWLAGLPTPDPGGRPCRYQVTNEAHEKISERSQTVPELLPEEPEAA